MGCQNWLGSSSYSYFQGAPPVARVRLRFRGVVWAWSRIGGVTSKICTRHFNLSIYFILFLQSF